MKFRTQYNQKQFAQANNERGHDIDEKTGKRIYITLPDQSLTVKQMFERYRVGLPLMGSGKTPVYHMDDKGDAVYVPDMDKLDLAEIEELKRNLNDRVGELRVKAKEEYDAFLKDKAEKRRKDEEKWLEKQAEKLAQWREKRSSGDGEKQ